ncbi:hypothetical protein RN001_005379 [Aquatica leii]|uniref:Uncharacterized protein n=1 Tax=Aquatica leii TaxID=1421715 RepID=A0AAN7SS20_9COLE|nr:hypothetical protein RN001_005379 [Aquatica leii]
MKSGAPPENANSGVKTQIDKPGDGKPKPRAAPRGNQQGQRSDLLQHIWTYFAGINTGTVEDLPQESFDVNEKKNVDIQPSTSKEIVTIIHQISQVPSAAAKRATSRRQKPGKSEILTSPPYKNALIENKATKVKPPVVKMQQLKGKKANDPTKIKSTKKSSTTPKTTISQPSVTEKTICLICQEDNDED